MLLRKFEAYGFKSFADKIELEFEPGITAIVGPNGSGKSNIADAIRWALGEQSIRDLRGTKMEDVIFSGSLQRRSLGVAEVSLTIDNTNGLLPIDYREVVITRRAFRSGEGEYFINKSPCRLKDIQSMLADTGLGKNSLAVIGQNKVDEILNSKPDERRLLFEETAGITKYKNKKREALRKLEETDRNLLRINDITSEIETQLQPLAESAERTTRYNQLADHYKKLQITLLLQKWENANVLVDDAQNKQQALTDEQVILDSKLNLQEVENDKCREELEQHTDRITKQQQTIAQYNLELKELNGQIEVLKERVLNVFNSLERNTLAINEIQQKQSNFINIFAEQKNLLSVKQHEKSQIEKALQELIVENQQVCAATEIITQKISSGKDMTFDYMQNLVVKRNELHSLDKELLLLQQRKEILIKEKQEVLSRVESVKSNQAVLNNEITKIHEKKNSNRNSIKQLQSRRVILEQQLNSIVNKKNLLSNQYQQALSRRKILKVMQSQYDGFSREIKSILLNNSQWRKSINGVVAELITVPPKYVTAIEVALGGAIQSIITEDEHTAKQAIEYLKSQNLGRATFLPITTIQRPTLRDYERSAAELNGVDGLAVDLINFTSKYNNIFHFLLGRTIIVEDISRALEIAKRYSFRLRLVTMQGELVSPGGSLTGGGRSRKESSYISRSNEIEVCERQIQTIESQIQELDKDISIIYEELSGIQNGLENFDKEIQSMEVKLAENTILLKDSEIEFKNLIMMDETIKTELNSIQDDIQSNAQKTEDVKLLISELEVKNTVHNQDIISLQQQQKAIQTRQVQLQDIIVNQRVELSKTEKDIAILTEKITQLTVEKNKQDQLMQKLEQENITLITARDDINHLIEQYTVSQQNLQTQIHNCQQECDLLITKKFELTARIQQFEKILKDLQRKININQNRIHDLQLIITKYSYEENNCTEQLAEKFELTLETSQPYKLVIKHDELVNEINYVNQKITDLGPVNLTAIDDYQKIKNRYDFLLQQYNDLISAKQYLHSVIHDIDKTMSKQFQIAFKEIDEHFKKIFEKLFGGGNARLCLVEPDNILDTGIDIIVQPPGKKQQNLGLLSGGERALTVIALLFSLLAYKPAPFCVLDEVDAALDEANVERFGNFLSEYAGHTQFIVVTHRKGTMEIAKVLHGITMEESGVSKLVSVKLADKVG